jgi:hypothetical protein
VGGEDGGYVDVALLAKRDSDTSKPLVKLDNDSPLLLVVNILHGVSMILLRCWAEQLTSPRNHATR